MEQNLAKTEWLSSKKSFVIYCQILLKDVTKVGLNFVHFSWTKVKEMKPKLNKS
jgi:hypothetical protein